MKNQHVKNGYMYVYCPEHPNKNQNGYVRRSRLVIERRVGRYLCKSEIVHHINENRLDDRESNLILFKNNSEHLRETRVGYTRKRIHERFSRKEDFPDPNFYKKEKIVYSPNPKLRNVLEKKTCNICNKKYWRRVDGGYKTCSSECFLLLMQSIGKEIAAKRKK